MTNIEQKNINLWLDEDLAEIFQLLNRQENRFVFNHELEHFFQKYHVNYIVSYEDLNINKSSFENNLKIIRTISRIILRISFLSRNLKKVVENFSFIELYI